MKRNVAAWLLRYTYLVILNVLFVSASFAAPKLEYILSMDQPQTHYFDVQIKASGFKGDYIDFKMPVWTPGSYLIREYARNVEGFVAKSTKDQDLKSEKINKNTWRVYTPNSEDVSVQYKVYAYEISVRTPYIDASHGYVQGAAVFMFIDKHMDLPSTLTVKPYKGWNQISTGLAPVGKDKFVLQVPNFDILVDSPIEIGTHKIFEFSALGIPHRVAMYGVGNYNEKKLLEDMKTVVEETAKVVGENPNKDYTFIVHNLQSGGGGLEHLNSTTLQTTRFSYETNYIGFLSLVAHEYFHLWNVKRIRPKALGPFDYEKENYTHGLWFSEGVTSYYDELIVRRAGLMGPDQYLNALAGSIGTIENAPGNKVQSVAESSFDAWIKFYRPGENSNNSTVSYYTKGGVLGALLDLEIMHSTGGAKNLDHVMRLLYEEYYKKQKRGFTDEELQKAFETVTGKSMDSFFKNYIFDTKPIDYNQYLGYVGLRLTDYNANRNDPYLGVSTSATGGKLTVTNVMRGTAAYEYGLNVNDEIIAVDGFKVTDDINKLISGKKVGDKITILINRYGILQNLEVVLGKNPNGGFRIERAANPTPEQEALLKSWLKL